MASVTVTRFNHVAYPISERRKALPFYRDLLGLAIIPSMVDDRNIIWTQMANGTMLHQIEAPEPGSAAGFHVAFQVEDIQSTTAALRASGVEIQSQGERHDGQEFAFVTDPDGNRLEFATRNDRKPHGRVCDEWGVTEEGDGDPSRHESDAPIRLQKVEHYALPITDRKRSVAFYRNVVGLVVIPSMVDSDSITWLGLPDGSMMHLIEPRADGSAAACHAAFEVPDYDAALAALAAAGIDEPRQGARHDGRRAMHFTDPDGNQIELVSNEAPRTGHRVADEWGYTREA